MRKGGWPVGGGQQYGPTMKIREVVALAALVLTSATEAQAAFGPWVEGQQSRARLIVAGPGADGKLDAGVEIELSPGWKTYWRTPGDAGIAPLADFSASTNVGPVTISFPVPHRFDDGAAVSNVYEDGVLLPLMATMTDPAAETELTATLDIGVCAEVCIPEHFEIAVTLPAGATDPVVAKRLKAARDLVPGAPEPGAFAVEGITRQGGSDVKPVFEFDALVPQANGAEVYVEGPPDWYAGTPEVVSTAGGDDPLSGRFRSPGREDAFGRSARPHHHRFRRSRDRADAQSRLAPVSGLFRPRARLCGGF